MMTSYLRGILFLLVPGVGQLLQGRDALGWFFLSGFGLLVALGVVGYLTLWPRYLWAFLATATVALYWTSGADFGRHHALNQRAFSGSITDSISMQVVHRAHAKTPLGKDGKASTGPSSVDREAT